MHESSEMTAIRRRMAEVRCELHQDIKDVAENARALGDWRYYAKTYPFICMGGALAIGYFLIPRRTKVRFDVQDLARTPELAGISEDLPARISAARPSILKSAGWALLSLAGKFAVRSALTYFEQQTGQRFNRPLSGSASAASQQWSSKTDSVHSFSNLDESKGA